MKLIRKIIGKNKGKKIAILGCVHGNEDYSLKVFKKLKKISLKSGEIDFYLVNEQAYSKKTRFIDTDLNRSFNLNKVSYEVNLTKTIKEKIKTYDYIIDMHSTTSKTPPCLIYTNRELEKNDVINLFNIKRRVYIPNSEFSLISQFKNAVSIEISIKNEERNAIRKGEKYILSFLSNLNLINKNCIKIKNYENYICTGKIDIEKNFKDFKITKINSEYLYPMLSGEVNYENQDCFKLKKLVS